MSQPTRLGDLTAARDLSRQIFATGFAITKNIPLEDALGAMPGGAALRQKTAVAAGSTTNLGPIADRIVVTPRIASDAGLMNAELYDGVITTFNNLKGYGFIRANGRSDCFFHVRAVPEGFEPKRGQALRFALGTDREGRPAAAAVYPIGMTDTR